MCVSGCKKVKTEKINYAFDEISEENREREAITCFPL